MCVSWCLQIKKGVYVVSQIFLEEQFGKSYLLVVFFKLRHDAVFLINGSCATLFTISSSSSSDKSTLSSGTVDHKLG